MLNFPANDINQMANGGFCQTEEIRGQSIDRSRWANQNKNTYKESLTEIEDIMKRIKFVEGNNFKRDPAYFKERPKVDISKARANYNSTNPQQQGYSQPSPNQIHMQNKNMSNLQNINMNVNTMNINVNHHNPQYSNQVKPGGSINLNINQINIQGLTNNNPQMGSNKKYAFSGKEFGINSDKITLRGNPSNFNRNDLKQIVKK